MKGTRYEELVNEFEACEQARRESESRLEREEAIERKAEILDELIELEDAGEVDATVAIDRCLEIGA